MSSISLKKYECDLFEGKYDSGVPVDFPEDKSIVDKESICQYKSLKNERDSIKQQEILLTLFEDISMILHPDNL